MRSRIGGEPIERKLPPKRGAESPFATEKHLARRPVASAGVRSPVRSPRRLGPLARGSPLNEPFRCRRRVRPSPTAPLAHLRRVPHPNASRRWGRGVKGESSPRSPKPAGKRRRRVPRASRGKGKLRSVETALATGDASEGRRRRRCDGRGTNTPGSTGTRSALLGRDPTATRTAHNSARLDSTRLGASSDTPARLGHARSWHSVPLVQAAFERRNLQSDSTRARCARRLLPRRGDVNPSAASTPSMAACRGGEKRADLDVPLSDARPAARLGSTRFGVALGIPDLTFCPGAARAP